MKMAYLAGIFIHFGTQDPPGIQQINRESFQKLIDNLTALFFPGIFFYTRLGLLFHHSYKWLGIKFVPDSATSSFSSANPGFRPT